MNFATAGDTTGVSTLVWGDGDGVSYETEAIPAHLHAEAVEYRATLLESGFVPGYRGLMLRASAAPASLTRR